MKVLFIAGTFQPAWEWGGNISADWNLVRGLQQAGVQITVLSTDARPRGRLQVPPDRVEDGVRIITTPVLGGGALGAANRLGVSLSMVSAAARLMGDCDLVHIDGFWMPLYPLIFTTCRLRRRPYFITVHGNLDAYSLDQKRFKKQLYLNLVARRDMLRAAGIHYTTLQEQQGAPAWLRDGCDSIVVPNAVEVPHDGDGRRFRRKLEAADDETLLGMVGRIHKKKGFDIILPALAAASSASPVRLVVVGPDEGGYSEEVRAMIEHHQLGRRVSFTGMITGQELADAYAGMDALVLPSYEENFGMVVVEAAAQGTPVMISEEVGLRHWVEQREVGRVLPLSLHPWIDLVEQINAEYIRGHWQPNTLKEEAREGFSLSAVGRQMARAYERQLHRGRRT